MDSNWMKDDFVTRDVTDPKEGLVVYKNSYWACVDGDPTKALFYATSPQCNQNKCIAEWIHKKEIYPKRFESVQIVFIETAFVPRRD